MTPEKKIAYLIRMVVHLRDRLRRAKREIKELKKP